MNRHTVRPDYVTSQKDPVLRLVGSRIKSFGMNAAGEIYLLTDRGDEFRFAAPGGGEVEMFEIERKRA